MKLSQSLLDAIDGAEESAHLDAWLSQWAGEAENLEDRIATLTRMLASAMQEIEAIQAMINHATSGGR